MKESSGHYPGQRLEQLAPWEQHHHLSPFRLMREMQHGMDRLFDIFFESKGATSLNPTSPRTSATFSSSWSPTVDLSENDHEFCVEAELPGVNKEDIEVKVEEGYLILHARLDQERKSGNGQQRQAGESAQQNQQQQPERRYLQRERRFGLYERAFPIPSEVKEDAIQCEFKDGVLTIHLPKGEAQKENVRRIPINQSAR